MTQQLKSALVLIAILAFIAAGMAIDGLPGPVIYHAIIAAAVAGIVMYLAGKLEREDSR